MARILTCRPAERGTILICVLFFVLILGGLSAAALSSGLAEQRSIHHHETACRALEIAEVGLARSELEIIALEDLGTDGVGVVAGSVGGGTYEAAATQDVDYPNRWEARARGVHGLSARRIAVGLRRRDAGFWVEGLFARTTFSVNGGISTDSYDSRKGDYLSQAVHADGGGVFANTRGGIGSNGALDLSGTSVHVRGDAIPGPGFTVKMSGQPNVGDTVSRTEEIPLVAPPYPEFEAAYKAPDNLNMLVRVDDGDGINGDAAELVTPKTWKSIKYSTSSFALRPGAQTKLAFPGGTYFFTDLDLSGGASLEILGPCTIYVTGNLNLTGGGLVNTTGLPEDCRIFAHPYVLPANHNPAKASITVVGGAQVATAIYAPYRDAVITGNGDLFGAIVGQSVSVNGDARLHYDEALADQGEVNQVIVERLYWRELGNLDR